MAAKSLTAVSMKEFREHIFGIYREKSASKGTYNRVGQVIGLLEKAGARTPSEIDDALIDRLVKSLPSSNTERTNFAILRSCRAVCGHGFERGFIPVRPKFPRIPAVCDFPRAKRPFRLSVDDWVRLWEYFRGRSGTLEGLRIFVVFALASAAGLRRDEILHLLWEDIDLVGAAISVRRRERSVWTKLSSPVRVPAKLSSVLASWRPHTDGVKVFAGKKGGFWDGTGSKRIHAIDQLKAAGVALGIQGVVHFESLRLFFEENPFAVLETNVSADLGEIDRTEATLDQDPKLGPNRVVIGGPSDPIWIRGKNKGVLNPVPYRTVKALWDAGERDGLSGTELKDRAKAGGAVNAWTNLRNCDEDWRDVLPPPGKGYPGSPGRYRLLR